MKADTQKTKQKRNNSQRPLRQVKLRVRRKISLYEEIMECITSFHDRIDNDNHFYSKARKDAAKRALVEMIGQFQAIKGLRNFSA